LVFLVGVLLGSKKWCHDDKSHASSVSVAHWRPVVVSAIEVPGASSAPWGATGAEVADTGPGWVIAPRVCYRIWWRGVSASILESAAGPSLGSSSTMCPWVSGLYLPGSPGAPPPPINWIRLEDEAKSTCS
jgi:hypothetical protein